jgi:hypothetical protein
VRGQPAVRLVVTFKVPAENCSRTIRHVLDQARKAAQILAEAVPDTGTAAGCAAPRKPRQAPSDPSERQIGSMQNESLNFSATGANLSAEHRLTPCNETIPSTRGVHTFYRCVKFELRT